MADRRTERERPLQGKVALVTGASRGIGAAVAVRLAQAGARVVVSARTARAGDSTLAGALEDTVEQIREIGGEACLAAADLTRSEDRERLVRLSVEAFGPVDILVNNAAAIFLTPMLQLTEAEFWRMLEVVVYAPFHLSQLVLPSMRERRTGWIVNMTSGAAAHPEPPAPTDGWSRTAYGLCKAALERFTTGLASEVTADGVTVSAIAPGLVETPMTQALGLVNDLTRRRLQPIELVAEAVCQLASATDYNGTINYASSLFQSLGLETATPRAVKA